MPFIRNVRVLFKTRLIFPRINGPTVYSITMFIDIFSYQLCGLTRRIISQPQDTQRSHQVNPTRVTGCPPQTLYTASPSFGNCLYSGKYLMAFIAITNTSQTFRYLNFPYFPFQRRFYN